MKWIHIDIWFYNCNFRTDRYIAKKYQEDFEIRIASFLENCKHLINRKFYLYEDIPHCFIALELKHTKYIKRIDQWRKIMFDEAPYIYKTYINNKAEGDKENGEGFLDILNAFTDFYLFRKDNRITHIIHCCMEFMMQSRQSECQFYQNMATLYQVRKIKNKKIVYGFKKLNPRVRKKMKRYVNQLDLRRRK